MARLPCCTFQLCGEYLALEPSKAYNIRCGPCKVAGPQYETLAEQYKDKAKFFKVDVDDAQDVAQEYGIASMPTFIVGFDTSAGVSH